MDNRIREVWNQIVERDRITATYKFALAKALIYLGDGRRRSVGFDELAYYYSRELCSHIKRYKRQSTFKTSKFIRSCKEYNAGKGSIEELKGITISSGLNSILETFHNLDEGKSSIEFFKVDFSRKHILITSEMVIMVMKFGKEELLNHIEEKWNEVEKGWGK